MSTQVDIAGLDKFEVMAALHTRTHAQGLGFLHDNGPLSAEVLRGHYKGQVPPYIDYLAGRVMKVDLNGDSFDPWGYDRDNFPGAAAEAIAPLRAVKE